MIDKAYRLINVHYYKMNVYAVFKGDFTVILRGKALTHHNIK